jgi:hypothetical protein
MDDPRITAQQELALVRQFREGALIYHFGLFMADNAIQDKGLDIEDRATDTLEALRPDGLLAILPLLDDPDPAVRSGTAARLLDVMEERAIVILEELKDCDHLEASTSARLSLLVHTMRKGGDWHKYS